MGSIPSHSRHGMQILRSFLHTPKSICSRTHPIASHHLPCTGVPSNRHFTTSSETDPSPPNDAQLPRKENPLPSLPPRLKNPAYVTDEEFRQYILPITFRPWRWQVDIMEKDLLIRNGELVEQKYAAPTLRRSYGFKDLPTMAQFLSEAATTVAHEKHEPTTIFIRGSRKEGGLVQSQFAFSTEQAEGAPSLLDPEGERIGPAITTQDVRMALILEERYAKRYLAKGLGEDPAFDINFQKNWQKPYHASGLKRAQRRLSSMFMRRMLLANMNRPDMTGVEPQPIPDAPEPSGEPCTDEHFRDVILPLYTRGWNIAYYNRVLWHKGKYVAVKLPALYGFYKFNSFATAIAFSQDALQLAQEEKFPISARVDSHTVLVERLTPYQRKPEINVNYVRFAVLIERLFTEKYADKAITSSAMPYANMMQPRTVREMIRNPLRWDLKEPVLELARKRNEKRRKQMPSSTEQVDANGAQKLDSDVQQVDSKGESS